MSVDYEMLRDQPGFVVKVYRRGTPSEYFSTWCPWHDDVQVPSLMVYMGEKADPDGVKHFGYWKCLAGCGMGSLDSLWRKRQNWMKRGNKPKPTSVDWRPPFLPSDIEQQWILVTVAHQMLVKYPDLGWYLKQRGVESQIVPRYLGFHNGWISVPIFDEHDNLETIMLRATPPVQKAGGVRFHCPHETSPTLYIPDRALWRRSDKVAVVYGLFDALTMADLNIPVATPIHGNESLRAEHLSDDKKYVLFSDEPEHEYKVTHRLAEAMLNNGQKVEMGNLPYEDGIKDPNGFYELGRKDDLVRALVHYF